MAGVNNNLKPVRSKSEATARGRKGGIASGKTRGAQKAIKELILATASEDMEAVVQAMFKAAQKGDVNAAKFIADYSGQKPKNETEVTGAGGGALVVCWANEVGDDG